MGLLPSPSVKDLPTRSVNVQLFSFIQQQVMVDCWRKIYYNILGLVRLGIIRTIIVEAFENASMEETKYNLFLNTCAEGWVPINMGRHLGIDATDRNNIISFAPLHLSKSNCNEWYTSVQLT